MIVFESLIDASWWHASVLGNPIFAWAHAAAWFVVLLIVLKLFEWLIFARLRAVTKRTKTSVDDALVAIATSIRPRFYVVIAIWASLNILSLSYLATTIINVLTIIVVVYQIAYSLQVFIAYLTENSITDQSKRGAIRLIGGIAKAAIWIFAVLLLLSNVGVDITSLVAGLGIGGIAIALAVQNILSDLFSSFSIYFDKPFEVGDFIVAGDSSGTVKKIGIKTTRITSLDGEEIVIPNKELVSSRVHNYKKMQKRRVAVHFGVEYDTPREKLEAIPGITQEAVEACKEAEFDRCHFFGLGDSALEFELIYYVNGNDYSTYMDANQMILLGIKERCDRQNIAFAFPTSTVHVVK